MRDLIKANAGLLLAGILTFVVMGAGQSLYGPALPAFSRQFGVSVAEAGLLVSAHWVGCFIGIAGMYLAGARVTPRLTLALMAVGGAVVAALAGWWLTVLGAVIFGIGYGCATAVFNPRVLRAFGSSGPSMLSLLNATFGIGAIAAPLVFVQLSNDPRWAFGLVAVICAGIWAISGPAGRVGAGPASGTVQAFRPHWGILGFGLVAIGMEACLIGLGPTALIRAGESETRAAELLSLFFLFFLLARVGLIFAAHLLPSFTLFTGAILLTALFSLGAALFDAGLFFVAMGFCTGMFFPGFYVTASRKMGEDLRVPPTIIAAGLVGGIFSPLIMAPLVAGMASHGFFWIIAGIAGTLSVIALVMLRGMNR